jgi:hypothetical protein
MTEPLLNPDARLQRALDVVATEMNGETVMMDIEKGTYFALTGSGGQIWAALEAPATLAEVIAVVEREFDVSAVDGHAAMVTEFVAKLLDQGLVTLAQ